MRKRIKTSFSHEIVRGKVTGFRLSAEEGLGRNLCFDKQNREGVRAEIASHSISNRPEIEK